MKEQLRRRKCVLTLVGFECLKFFMAVIYGYAARKVWSNVGKVLELMWFSATLLFIIDSWSQYPKSIDTMPNADEELHKYYASDDRPSCSNAWYTVESVDNLMVFHDTRYWSKRAYHQKHGISVESNSWNFIRLSTLSTVYQALEQEGLSVAAWYPGSSSSSFGIVSMDFGYWPQESKMQSNVAENHTRAPAESSFPHLHFSTR